MERRLLRDELRDQIGRRSREHLAGFGDLFVLVGDARLLHCRDKFIPHPLIRTLHGLAPFLDVLPGLQALQFAGLGFLKSPSFARPYRTKPFAAAWRFRLGSTSSPFCTSKFAAFMSQPFACKLRFRLQWAALSDRSFSGRPAAWALKVSSRSIAIGPTAAAGKSTGSR